MTPYHAKLFEYWQAFLSNPCVCSWARKLILTIQPFSFPSLGWEMLILRVSQGLKISWISPKFWSLFISTIFLKFINVSWKVEWLTKIISWNVTKWDLFFNLVLYTLFPSVLQCLDPIDQKVHMMTTYLLLMSFLSVRSKHCNIKKYWNYWKINLIWSHFMRVSWSAYGLFNWPSYLSNHSTMTKFLVWIQNFPKEPSLPC